MESHFLWNGIPFLWNGIPFFMKYPVLEPDTERDLAEAMEFRDEENFSNYDAIYHATHLYPKLIESGCI